MKAEDRIFRRQFLKTLGIAGGGGLVGISCGRTDSVAEDTPASATVGALDLEELEIIDTHVHPPNPITLEESYNSWNSSFVDAMLPDFEFEGKDDLRGRLDKDFKTHLYNLPRQTGYYNYMARVYGVEPTLEGFDSVVRSHLDDFSGYIRSILDREKVAKIVLQSRSPEPRPPETPVPQDRFVWTYAIGDIIQPMWAKEQGPASLDELTRKIDGVLEGCKATGCSGFKVAIAYYRRLAIQPVERTRAETAFAGMLSKEPSGFKSFPGPIPYYDDPALAADFTAYQDYLLKHIFVRAGALRIPIVIHVAVALHPALQFEFNNPLDLYWVFQDDEIQQAETQFALIHTGYPYHHLMASLLSQFPNVFTDLSFYSKFPGVLEETLRAFLSLAPPEKVMHGSDSNNVPEEIGYCASNTRRVLARILRDFKTNYGWTQSDCERIARKVLSENARRVFQIT